MKTICLLASLLMLLALAPACLTVPRQCNYGRPNANYNEDRYRCQMLAEAKRMNTGDPSKYYGMKSLWVTDCLAQLGWQTCRQ